MQLDEPALNADDVESSLNDSESRVSKQADPLSMVSKLPKMSLETMGLVLLFGATSWVVGAYASFWLLFPYWIAFAGLLGFPYWGSQANSKANRKGKPRESGRRLQVKRVTEEVPLPALAVVETAMTHEPPPGLVEEGPNGNPLDSPAPPIKAKKAKGRSRKAKNAGAEPAAVATNPKRGDSLGGVSADLPKATWVQVGPGKFVRADLLPEAGLERPWPNAPMGLPAVAEETSTRDLHPHSEVSEAAERVEESVAVERLVETETEAGDNGNTPEVPSVDFGEPAIDGVRVDPQAPVALEIADADDVDIDAQAEWAEEFVEADDRPALSRPFSLESPQPVISRPGSFSRSPSSTPISGQGPGGPRGRGRRRGLVEAGAGAFGDRDRIQRLSAGSMRGVCRGPRSSAQGRGGRAGRSYPPRPPPRRRLSAGWGKCKWDQ